MADFRFFCEEANFLLDEIDCNPNSVLDGTSPGDGLNFDELDFDWDNEALDLTMGSSHHGASGPINPTAAPTNNRQHGYESPEHCSAFDNDPAATVTPRPELLDVPEPRHVVVGEGRANHANTKAIPHHGPWTAPSLQVGKNQKDEFEPVPLRDLARQPTRTQKSLSPVPDLPLSSAVSSRSHAVRGKPEAAATKTSAASRKARVVPSKPRNVTKQYSQPPPMESIAFSAGVSDENESTTLEAKRRRAVRKEILSSQRKCKLPLTFGAPPMSTDALSNREVAMEVTEIAQMLLKDASCTPVASNPFVTSLQSEAKIPCTTKVAPIKTKRDDAPVKQAPLPKVSVAKAKKASPVATTINKVMTCNSPAKSKAPKSAAPKVKASRRRSETSYDECMSMCPDGPGSADMPEHLSDLPAGTDPESRRQRRLIRNRLSAALHRKRKRDTIDNQQKVIDEKDDEIARLQKELNKVSANYKALKSDFDAVVNHYGYKEIKSILAQTPADSPPHLVNISGSDHSVGSSEDERTLDSNTVHSPRRSPIHTPSAMEDETSQDHQFQQHAVAHGHGHTSAVVHPHSKGSKKKRTVKALPAMATMAMCAVLGCVVLPPSVFKALDPDGTGLQAANVIISSDAGSDARRRLDEAVSPDEMSAMAKWSEMSVSKLMNEPIRASRSEERRSSSSQAGSSFVISPIESRPHLWRVDAASDAPWTVDRSITLFDFRAILAKQGTVPAPMKNSPVVPFRFASSLSREMAPKTVENKSALVRKDALKNLRGSPNEANSLDEDRDFATQTVSDTTGEEDTSLDTIRDHALVGGGSSKFGPNFMFCPSAFASVTPGFLQLAGLSEDPEVKGGESYNWAKGSDIHHPVVSDLHKSKEDTKSDMIVDFDDDEYVDDDMFEDAEEDEMDKALVPKYDFVKPTTSFPFAPRGGGAVPLIKNVFTGNDPYMSILVPASTLSTDLAFLESLGGEGAEPWIELGCQVLSAKLVDGVHFVGDSYSPLH